MNVTEIQRFCMHDGPGIRTVVFLKGCPLRCRWCHNPEMQRTKQEILFDFVKCIGCRACEHICPNGAHRFSGGIHSFDRALCAGCTRCASLCCSKALETSLHSMTVDEILTVVEKDRAFYGKTGGITLSGGEPMLQASEAEELLSQSKAREIGTAIETCGYFDPALLYKFVPLTDVFLWDFKDGNDERHCQYTGVSNKTIRENLLLADSLGAASVLRCIMVSGVNMYEDHYREIAAFWHQLRHCRYVELLPYHAYGGSKMRLLGGEDDGNSRWIPDAEALNEAREFLRGHGVCVKVI